MFVLQAKDWSVVEDHNLPGESTQAGKSTSLEGHVVAPVSENLT